MNNETLSALKGAIEKWERILKGEGIDEGTNNCPLCELFFEEVHPDVTDYEGCYGCPVRSRTKRGGCQGTPYSIWASEAFARHGRLRKYWTADTPELRALALEELNFLKSLLPECEQ